MKIRESINRIKKRLLRTELAEIEQIKKEITFIKDKYSEEQMSNRIEIDPCDKSAALDKAIEKMNYVIYEMNQNTNLLLYNYELRLNGLVKPNFKPLVSIIIPVYNGSNYVKEAIDSALAQTYKNIEIIVVNDGSTDEGKTEKIVLSYGDKVRYLKKENGGVSSALNLGIKNMKGEYFAWLSHDDVYFPNNIEVHIDYLRHTKEQNIITYTSFNAIDENSDVMLDKTVFCGLYLFDYKKSKKSKYQSLLYGEINGCAVLIPKSVFDEIGGFDEALRYSQERDMWARILKKYWFMNIPIITFSTRIHNERVSTKQKEKILCESQKKMAEIIENIAIEEKQSVYGSEYKFYQELNEYYKIMEKQLDYINNKLEELKGERKNG